MFVDRRSEMDFLNSLLQRNHPQAAQLVLLYGRRRVGKTSLLRQWTAQAGLPAVYWSAEKEPAALQRRKFYAALLGIPASRAPLFESWGEALEAAAGWLGEQRRIVVIDELPYAAESDPGMLSALQHAWDRWFKPSNLVIVLCGSQVHTMETLMAQQSPLFGRFTGQWRLEALPFSSLGQFLPGWSAAERVAGYALVGGVPAYLEWLDPRLPLEQNIRQVMLSPGSMFVAEPSFLLYDEVREPNVYLAILKAIGLGAHTQRQICQASLVDEAHLSAYLGRLQELSLVERRLPALLTPAEWRKSRQGRYHLRDAYFRFYFRFLAPYHDTLTFDAGRVLDTIKEGLRAFVGQTAFEDLSRQWVARQGAAGDLPFEPEAVGSHWDADVQVDVAAANWHSRDILLGECKWGAEGIDRQVVRELVEHKAPKVLARLPQTGTGWKVHFAIFTRARATSAARAELEKAGGRLVDLKMIDEGLCR